jgi:Domain of unknown function (DUF1707)
VTGPVALRFWWICAHWGETPVTIQPGDDTAAGKAGHGHLRASHADREQVIGTLQAAFVQGMLAKDEFDLRVGQALASRTYAQLATVTSDLPTALTAAQPPQPARAQDKGRIPRPGRLLMVATVVYAGMWPLTLLLPRNSEGDPVDGFDLVILTGLAYGVLLILVLAQISMDWQDKRARRQPPKGHASGAGGQGAPAPALS